MLMIRCLGPHTCVSACTFAYIAVSLYIPACVFLDTWKKSNESQQRTRSCEKRDTS